MPDSFGGRLRERRESLAIPLATIAQQTKIKESLLEGLERDDLSYWPSGIFRRAYVRSYAEAIGLNADAVLREFLALYPDPAEMFPAERLPPPESNGSRPHAPPTRLRYLLGSAFGGRKPTRSSPIPRVPASSSSEVPARAEPLTLPLEPAAPPVEPTVSSVEEAKPHRSEPARTTIGPDLEAVAELCGAFGRIGGLEDLERLLQQTAALLQATGLVVWVWDESGSELRPAVAAGYSPRVLARLPAVRRDADNATAEAFRSGQPCRLSGAAVVPIVTAEGCAGVLAMEFAGRDDPPASVQAAAGIIAAFLALLIAQTSAAQGEATDVYSSDRRASGAS